MITSSSGLGWNPFHALKRVASNPLVQNVAKAEANQYAPGAVADVNKARSIYQSAQGPQPGPGGPHGGKHGPIGPTMPDDGGGAGVPAGAQNSHILLYGLVGAGILVAILVMKK